MSTLTAKIQLRKDTSANWTANNPVLLSGEFALTTDVFYAGTDQMKIKVGDGVQTWTNLDYMPIGDGAGTVTSVSVVSANGLAGTVANATTTPAITLSTSITGILKGNGTAISAAVAGTDYVVPADLASYVPYSGATGDVDLGNYSLNAKNIHIKGTLGNGHLGLKFQSSTPTASASESSIFADSNGDIAWQNGNLYSTTLKTSANSANRTYTFPDRTGTLADNTDLAGKQNLATILTTFSALANSAGWLYNNGAGTLSYSTPTKSDVGLGNVVNSLQLVAANNLSDVVSASTSRTNLGATTVGANLFTATNPSAVTWTRINADNTVSFLSANNTLNAILPSQGAGTINKFLQSDGTNTSWVSGNAGTVTSVAMTVPSFLSVSGSPITSSGTLAVTLSGTALPVANGGTGATSASITAFNNITGYSAAGATGTTSTNLVFSTSPTLVTPNIGAATGTSLDTTGAHTSGVASSAAGTLILRNATNAFTQTIRGTNPSASITYDLPTTAPTAGQVLSSTAPSAGVATLSWTTASSGITINSTSITSGGAGRVLFENSSNQVSESVNEFYFTSSSPFSHIFAAGRTGTLTGVDNILLGYQAGKVLTTATDNVFVGHTSGVSATSSWNVAIGSQCGSSITTGQKNTFVGSYLANSGNVTGDFNTSVGHGSMQGIGAGTQSSALGYFAIGQCAPSYAVGIGTEAGRTYGGNYSIYIGYQSDGNLSAYTNGIAIGAGSKIPANHAGVLGSNDANGYVDTWYFNNATHSAPYSVVLNASGGSGTNIAGASFTIAGGKGTGTGAGGDVKKQTSVKGSSGTTLQTLGDRQSIVGKYTDLTESSATAFVRVNVPSNTVAGGTIIYTIQANDATDYQSLTGRIIWDAVNKGGTTTIVITDTQNGTGACSSGTLTNTTTAVDSGSGNVDFKLNAVSSLTQTTLRVNCQVFKNFGTGSISGQ